MLFATHFHELTQQGQPVKNRHVTAHATKTRGLAFHEVADGPCTVLRHQGRRIGGPPATVQVAKRKAEELESYQWGKRARCGRERLRRVYFRGAAMSFAARPFPGKKSPFPSKAVGKHMAHGADATPPRGATSSHTARAAARRDPNLTQGTSKRRSSPTDPNSSSSRSKAIDAGGWANYGVFI